MKFVFVLAVLALAIAVTECIVCAPDFCDRVRCQQATQDECSEKNQTFVENGSTCGCCDVCRVIEKGGNCFSLLLRGVPPSAECEEGTYCKNVGNNTYKCED